MGSVCITSKTPGVDANFTLQWPI